VSFAVKILHGMPFFGIIFSSSSSVYTARRPPEPLISIYTRKWQLRDLPWHKIAGATSNTLKALMPAF
jgi:hypothetical protein